MSEKRNRELRGSLAVAIAAGQSAAAWAREHKVPRRTAYRWTRDPQLLEAVATIRRRALDRAAGNLARAATAAAQKIAKLATSAESEAVRLAAARAVVADLMTITNFAAIDARLNALESALESKVNADDRR